MNSQNRTKTGQKPKDPTRVSPKTPRPNTQAQTLERNRSAENSDVRNQAVASIILQIPSNQHRTRINLNLDANFNPNSINQRNSCLQRHRSRQKLMLAQTKLSSKWATTTSKIKTGLFTRKPTVCIIIIQHTCSDGIIVKQL